MTDHSITDEGQDFRDRERLALWSARFSVLKLCIEEATHDPGEPGAIAKAFTGTPAATPNVTDAIRMARYVTNDHEHIRDVDVEEWE